MTSTAASSFVGRAEELDRLLALLDRAERGRPAVGLVAGDAGVGKTRLLDELAARAEGRGARVLVGGCMEVGDVGLPYVPFIDAFRDLGRRPGEAEVAAPLAAAVPSLGRLLPELASDHEAVPPPGDGFERVQLFDGVLSLLVRLSEVAPLLLVIEDLHWADRSTRDLLAFLIRTLRGGRVALVASYRSDELHRRHPLRPLLAELVRLPDLERIELSPFGRAELAEHLQAVAGQPVPPAVVDRILARSEGNAFFAEELVAAGAIRADIALPDALADVLLGRIEALPELAQDVLKVAAVAGRRVGHQLLVAASGRPEAEVERGLRDAIAGQVLVASAATESYRFRHALLQEAVYGDLLPGERTRLHATYARLLAAADPGAEDGSASAAELAWHCLASHDLPGRAGGAGPGGRPRRHRVRPQRGLPPPHPGPRAVEPGSGARRRGRRRPGRGAGPGGRGGQPLRRVPAGRRSSPRRPWRRSTRTPSRCGRPWSTTASAATCSTPSWSWPGPRSRCWTPPGGPSSWSPSSPRPRCGPPSRPAWPAR